MAATPFPTISSFMVVVLMVVFCWHECVGQRLGDGGGIEERGKDPKVVGLGNTCIHTCNDLAGLLDAI